jgi:uncharacterized protein YdiU (UPF0061 family)
MPLKFANRFVDQLPADPIANTPNHSTPTSSDIALSRQPRQVRGACYSKAWPLKPADPKLLCVADEVAHLLGVSPEETKSAWFLNAFSGRELLPEMQPFAMCYGGHQFGHWAGQLGDGRAINLGEVIGSDSKRWMLQLKGSGPTPYSRQADGLAVLRSSIREFLCSEAMHHLGVPTTRALCLIGTGEQVVRDMFYDGRPRREPGAIVCRVAPSFVRFGNFEILAARQEVDLLKQLIDYVILTDFPELLPSSCPTEKDSVKNETVEKETIVAWFHEICRRTAIMIVEWMRVGFVHGVMNTDNMSILGLTIDYGPYGWLEDYDPTWTPNTTDAQGRRYCYGQQPQIAYWNLAQLANAIAPCVDDSTSLEEGMKLYVETMRSQWQNSMARKLGLSSWDSDQDSPLVEDLFELLRSTEIDMTWFYQLLASWMPSHTSTDSLAKSATSDSRRRKALEHFQGSFYREESNNTELATQLESWLTRYEMRSHNDGIPSANRLALMKRANPRFVLRNYLAQQAIEEAEAGDPSRISQLLDVLRNPYDEQPAMQAFAQKRPEWARNKPGCSTLSCSS